MSQKIYHQTCKIYERAIKLAQDDWKLSIDGIVTALRYNTVNGHFIAKVNYNIDGTEKTEEMMVPVEWVIDVYGPEIMSKLMDRAEHDEFVQFRPNNTNAGRLPLINLETNRPVKRIKYMREGASTNDGRWLGMLDDNRVVTLEETFVEQNFSQRYVNECKELGSNKFVGIPIGSARKSVMAILPNLHSEGAPAIKYTQDDTDSCVFMSLASAFHSMGIPSLMRAANILVMRSKVLSGGVASLNEAKNIVEEHVWWLQPKKLRDTFDWEVDLRRNMFVLAILEDTRGSRQHAVTLF